MGRGGDTPCPFLLGPAASHVKAPELLPAGQGRISTSGRGFCPRPFKRRWRYMPRSTRKCPSFNAICLQAEWQLEHACHGRSTAPEELKPGVEQGLNLPFLPLPGSLRRRLRPPLPCHGRVSKPAPEGAANGAREGTRGPGCWGLQDCLPLPRCMPAEARGSLPGRMGQQHGQTQGHHAGGPALGRLEAVEGMPALTAGAGSGRQSAPAEAGTPWGALFNPPAAMPARGKSPSAGHHGRGYTWRLWRSQPIGGLTLWDAVEAVTGSPLRRAFCVSGAGGWQSPA